MKELDLEIMVLITAFDDTFHQTVHSRHSYTGAEIVSNAKFVKAFKPNDQGEIILNLSDLDRYEMVNE